MKQIWIMAFFLMGCMQLQAQTFAPKQKVKGVVIDTDSKKPLQGATVTISNTSTAAVTDADGNFSFADVLVGRISLEISMVGFEQKIVPDIIVISGKEISLNIAIVEKIKREEAVVVTSKKSKIKPANEFATASARAISMQETKRYPAAVNDPARMAQNFAGISADGDGSNEIVVRGNSPQGVLWRLEGVEIPSPNHFAGLGTTGGAVSMLSSSTIGNSDFYTGAFPAEFGNAVSGAFDLNYRTGNKDKKEFAFMVGTIGLEAAAEGPFKKGGKSSYLINYRYSTLALLSSFAELGAQVPKYQDANFKFNFPTKRAGTFGLFGLVGVNGTTQDPKKDSAKWDDVERNESFTANSSTLVVGLSHQIFLNKNSFIKTVIAKSRFANESNSDTLTPYLGYKTVNVAKEKNTDEALRISSYYNNKLSSKSTLRIGAIFSQLNFNYKNSYLYTVPTVSFKDLLAIDGSSNYIQGYVQLKYRLSEKLTLNTGLHTSYLTLNKTSSIEPRIAFTYNAGNAQTLTLAAGVHAKPQQLSTYYYETALAGAPRLNSNKNLKMTNATHVVLGYEKGFQNGIRLKTEVYYQSLKNIPVEKKLGSGFSAINASSVYDLFNTSALVSDGKGNNYGIDINLEKAFSRKYYFIANASLYKSTYTTYDNKTYDTRYNKSYQLNLVGGKEWSVSRRKNRTFGFNAKLLTSGGNRQSEIDLAASRLAGEQVLVAGKFFTQQATPYFRADIGLNLKTNRKKTTHTISIDIQNVINKKNEYGSYYDSNKGNVVKFNQLGLLPFINYRVEF
jgi:CarboxypepD_reg-like domain/TonB-dependent Receptor Plug Domain